jgi:hypothetical protein
MQMESQQADILLSLPVVGLTGGLFLKYCSRNSIYFLVSHEHVRYVFTEVCTERLKAMDIDISVLKQGKETINLGTLMGMILLEKLVYITNTVARIFVAHVQQ